MTYVFLIVAMGLFIAGLKLFDVVPKVRLVISETQEATSVMSSKVLSDEQKEAALQKAAVHMFGSFLNIFARVILTIVVPVASIILGSALGFYEIEYAAHVASEWSFIIGSTLVMIGAWFFIK